jgi:hypothetical protein
MRRLCEQQAFWRNSRVGGIEQQADHGHLRLNDDWPVLKLSWRFKLVGVLETTFIFSPEVTVFI